MKTGQIIVQPTLRKRGVFARIRDFLRPRREVVISDAGNARAYAAGRADRLTAGWQAGSTSADAELSSSLTQLRNRSRALVRDASYAKRAKQIVVNNVVGAGIGMQCQVKTTRDEPARRVNEAIEALWRKWSRAEFCHTGAGLDFQDLERVVMGQVFEAGEAFVRMHMRRFGDSEIPFALELIEAERVAGEFQAPMPGAGSPNNTVRLGVEVDDFYRPVAYWIRERHPGEIMVGAMRSDRFERIPAEQILHVRLVDRWPQTRGEPWLHTAARRLNDMDGYSEAEIVAARGAANYLAAIETPDADTALAETKADGTREIPLEPGTSFRLNPGEKMNFVSPNRPNPAMDPFMRMMLREVAAGAGVSYESLSRDYSQSNYSSSRLALIDDRDAWRVLQQWFIRRFRAPVYRAWLQQAVFAQTLAEIPVAQYAMDRERFEAVSWKPRGWSWIDPTKEVTAYKEAIKAGMTTLTDVVAQTGAGADFEDVLETRKHELELAAEHGLEFDTDPKAAAPAPAPAAPPADPQPGAGDEPGGPDGDGGDDGDKGAGDGDRNVIFFGSRAHAG